ncbi:hypothetical protein [Streptomyces sp. NPDC047525]|uniref:hypothetical protein n=1 Tax=Streptomyces sp. NPDC047525 TaxID=3155264 RepID=UPI0033DADE64
MSGKRTHVVISPALYEEIQATEVWEFGSDDEPGVHEDIHELRKGRKGFWGRVSVRTLEWLAIQAEVASSDDNASQDARDAFVEEMQRLDQKTAEAKAKK